MRWTGCWPNGLARPRRPRDDIESVGTDQNFPPSPLTKAAVLLRIMPR